MVLRYMRSPREAASDVSVESLWLTSWWLLTFWKDRNRAAYVGQVVVLN